MINLLGCDDPLTAHIYQTLALAGLTFAGYIALYGQINRTWFDAEMNRYHIEFWAKIYEIRNRYARAMDHAKENFIVHLKKKEEETKDPFYGAYRRAFEKAVEQERARTKKLCEEEYKTRVLELAKGPITKEEVPVPTRLPRCSLPVFRCIENTTTREVVFIQLPYESIALPIFPTTKPRLVHEKITSWNEVDIPYEINAQLNAWAKQRAVESTPKKPEVTEKTKVAKTQAVPTAGYPQVASGGQAPVPVQTHGSPALVTIPKPDPVDDLLADFQVASPSRMAAKERAMGELFRQCRQAGKDLGKYLVAKILSLGKRPQFIHPVVVPEAIHPISQRLIDSTTCERPVLSAKPKPHDPATLRRDIWLKESLIWCPEGVRPEDYQEQTRAKPGPINYSAEEWHLLLAQVRRNQVEDISPHRYTPEQEALLDLMFKDNQASVAVGLPSVHDFGPDFWVEKMGRTEEVALGTGPLPLLRDEDDQQDCDGKGPNHQPHQEDPDVGEEWKRGGV